MPLAALCAAVLLAGALGAPTVFLSELERPFQGQNNGFVKDGDDPRRQKPPVSLKDIRNMAGQMNKGLGGNRANMDPLGNTQPTQTDEKRTGQMKNVKGEMRDMFKQSSYARKITDFEDALINMELQPVDGNPEMELDDMNGTPQNNPDADSGIPPMPAELNNAPVFQSSNQMAQLAGSATAYQQMPQVEARYPPMQALPPPTQVPVQQFPQQSMPQAQMMQMPMPQQMAPQQMAPQQMAAPQQMQMAAPQQMQMAAPQQMQMAAPQQMAAPPTQQLQMRSMPVQSMPMQVAPAQQQPVQMPVQQQPAAQMPVQPQMPTAQMPAAQMPTPSTPAAQAH